MRIIIILAVLEVFLMTNNGFSDEQYKPLTPEEERVIVNKGTERPFSGDYYNFSREGTYKCKRCGAALYQSSDKFDSGCGWPSFDDEIQGAVKKTIDADGMRTEITCANCGAHLGHVFVGEHLTDKNTRHCVNSISLDFELAEEQEEETKMKKAYFASGCFWGTEYMLNRVPGVVSTQVGYTGGHKDNPTYKEVCTGKTGHAETVEVVFDPSQVTFEELAKVFFETHDPTQVNRQGPDIGDQYRSAIFYTDDGQKEVAGKLISILENKGMKIATAVEPAGKFWPAEDYHQNYYETTGGKPYCHRPKKLF